MSPVQQAMQLCNRSRMEWDHGQHKRAVRGLERAIELDPGNPHYMHILASWHHSLGDYDIALSMQMRVLKLIPRDAAAHQNLGIIYHALGRYQAAAASYHSSLEIDSTSAPAHSNLGKVLQLLGDHDKAEEHFDHALALQPGLPEALAGKAIQSELRGDFDAAFAVIDELRNKYPDNGELVITYARLAPRQGKTDDAIKHLERLISNPDNAFVEMQLHYSLADLYDKSRQFDRAFEHARSANRLNPMRFDHQRYEEKIKAAKRVFVTKTFETLPSAPRVADGITPLFIVGMPRSGTTLVEQILAAHPRVQTAGEMTTISELAADMQRRFDTRHRYPEALIELTADNLNDLAAAYLQRLTHDIDKTNKAGDDQDRVIDKMPANFLHLGFVSNLFPQASIIHCSRNPWDIALSCFMRSFSGQGLAFSNNLEDIGVYYEGYREMMDLWRQTISNPIIEVEYEALVVDPKSEVDRLLDMLQLDHDDACLRFYQNTGVVATASTAQVRKPIYGSSVGKAGNYREWLEPVLGRRISNRES